MFVSPYFLVGASAAAPALVKTVQVGYSSGQGDPQYLAYNPSNKFVYVSDYGYYCAAINGGCSTPLVRSEIVVIASGTNKIVGKVRVGYGASDIIYNPSNEEVYVVNQLNSTVSVLSGVSVVKTIAVGPQNCYFCFNLLYNPFNGDVYVANSGSNTVTVISSSTNSVITTITVGDDPVDLIYDGSNQKVYVENQGSNTVSVIKGTSLVSTITVGETPLFLTFDPSNNDIYVAYVGSGFYSDQVAVISGATNKVITTVSIYSGVGAILYDPANKEVYATGYANDGGGNQNNAFFFAISSSTNKIVANITFTDYFPVIQYLAYNPSNKDLYFAEVNGYSGGYFGALSPANRYVGNYSSTSLYYPAQITYNPSQSDMYVAYPINNLVGVFSS